MTPKLAAPQLPPGLVDRPHLTDRLSQGVSGRVTLVSAGPGWGKTMLVASWAAAQSSRQPTAWLSLDSLDNDPVLFWSHLAAAVHRAGELPGGTLGELVIRPPIGSDVLRRIAIALAELSQPTTLVLDDFGEINNPDILHGLRDILRHSSQLRLVVISRSDPSLNLQRLRVAGELVEIRAADLAFTEAESAELMLKAGVALPADITRRLHDRTEGWVAGLRLAALIADNTSPQDRLSAFTGADMGVAEYFAEEVMTALPDARRTFMMRTAVADRVCAALAEVLSDRRDSQRELDALEQANAFVVALDPAHQWFRYHPLLAEVLRHRLHLEEPLLASELHSRAARWYAGNGQALEAVRHAVQAQNWQLAGELMLTMAAIRSVSTEREAFAAVLSEVPAAVFESSAELRATAALRSLIDRDYSGFANHVGHARAMLHEREPLSTGPVEAFLAVADIALSRVRGDVPQLIAACTELLGRLAEAPLTIRRSIAQYEAPALSNLGLGLFWSARSDDAEESLRASLGVAAGAGAALTAMNSIGYLAMIEFERGHLRAAHDLASEGLETAARRGWTQHAQAIAIYLALAQTELEWNNIKEAHRLLDAGFAAQRNDPDRIPVPALHAARARLWLADRRVDRATQAITSAHAEVGGAGLPPLLSRQLALVAAEVDLAGGQAAKAMERLHPLVDGADAALGVALLGAQAQLALGDAAAAEAEVAPLREESVNPRLVTQAWLITALAADHLRSDYRALAALDRALAAAEPENIRRPFVALGDRRLEGMLKHRMRLTPREAPGTADFAAVILEELGPVDRDSVVNAPLAQPLTDREQVVLSHLATLKTLQEIAGDLYVSVNTVKAHVGGVYRKLEVPNRREAVKRARRLGLI